MRSFVSAVLLLSLASPCLAGGTGGATPLNSLFLDADARPVALGGAYAALARDANALRYNPAGLAFLESHHASFMHAEHFQGVTQEYLAAAVPGTSAGLVPKGAGAGLMLDTVSFGDVPRTTVSNPRGTGLGSFGIRDWTLAAGYGARTRWPWLGLGAALKYLREDIDSYSAQAAAVDLGLMAELDEAWGLPATLGASLQNLGTKLKFQSRREELPLNLRLGAAYRFAGAGSLALDVNRPKEGDLTMHLGAEYVVRRALALRLGYNGRNEAASGITMGGGLALKRWNLDYAFVPFGDLGSSHRFSVACRW